MKLTKFADTLTTPVAPKTVADVNSILAGAARRQGITIAPTPQKLAIAEFVTYDPAMLRVVEIARDASEFDFPVLILGETGTGKELLARIFHGNNNEQKIIGRTTIVTKDSFHAVNCSGIVDSLFESLLFGHTKGAFTGADHSTEGLFRTAGTGTLFFDEVGDLPPNQQTKLLRVLQTRQARAVGGSSEYTVECKFVFATNKNLKDMIAKGEFRSDLYHRINKIVLRTTPLRDRPLDVIPIASRIADNLGIKDVFDKDLDKRVEAGDEIIPRACYEEGNVRGIESYLVRFYILGMSLEECLRDL
jgi:transcriptional regulator with PAS, ATPase and Fis domain